MNLSHVILLAETKAFGQATPTQKKTQEIKPVTYQDHQPAGHIFATYSFTGESLLIFVLCIVAARYLMRSIHPQQYLSLQFLTLAMCVPLVMFCLNLVPMMDTAFTNLLAMITLTVIFMAVTCAVYIYSNLQRGLKRERNAE
jgi:hypothetical protein